MKLTNKFIIVVPVYNAKDLIKTCLSSILNQNFDDLGVIIRDDMSTDGTDVEIRTFLGLSDDNSFTEYNGKNVLFIRNEEKFYPVGNTYDSVMNYVDNDDAIIGVVDGDDSLISPEAVNKIFEIYQEEGKWLVWSQHMNSNGSRGQSNSLPPDDVIYSTRQYWSVSHFRTSRLFLYKYLDKNDILDPFVENSYFTYAGDAAFLFPFMEMCGNDKSYFLDEVLYLYNNELPTNEHNKDVNNAIKYGSYIRHSGTRYNKLTEDNLIHQQR